MDKINCSSSEQFIIVHSLDLDFKSLVILLNSLSDDDDISNLLPDILNLRIYINNLLNVILNRHLSKGVK